jgi:hypothetical protein
VAPGFAHRPAPEPGWLFRNCAALFIATSSSLQALGMDSVAALRFPASGACTIDAFFYVE